MRFLPAERFMLLIIATLAALDAVLLALKGVKVDVAGYTLCFTVGSLAIALGQYYRAAERDAGIALATTAAGLFIVFSLAGSVFNYLLLPVSGTRIDSALAAMDALIGYRWADFVTSAAEIPWLGPLTGLVYLSSLPQLIIVIVALGFTQQAVALHRFMLTGMIAAVMAICFWGLLPSSGPSAYQAVSEEVRVALRMVVGPDYGAELNRLAAEGPTMLSPKDTLGLIAFPSYHTVMALMSVWFMRSFPRIWPMVLVLNIIMLPAILIHGGHHVIDLVGGAATFGIAYVLSGVVVSRLSTSAQPDGGLAAPTPVASS